MCKEVLGTVRETQGRIYAIAIGEVFTLYPLQDPENFCRWRIIYVVTIALKQEVRQCLFVCVYKLEERNHKQEGPERTEQRNGGH